MNGRDMRSVARWRALTPDQEDEIRRAYASGTVRAVSLAQRYGVHVRTIYRTLRRAVHKSQVVCIAGMHATFEVGDDGCPFQVTPWRAA